MEIAPFPQTQPRCSICQFCTLSLPEFPVRGGSRREESLSLGKCPPNPELGRERVRHFSRPLGATGVATLQGCFSGRGTGTEQKDFRARPSPLSPPAHRREFQVLATSCPHMSLNIQGKQSPLENLGKLRATEWRLCGDLVPTPRGPGDRRGRGGAGGRAWGWRGGCGASRSCPGESGASSGPGWAPRAPGGGSPRRRRGRRVPGLSPPREREPPN